MLSSSPATLDAPDQAVACKHGRCNAAVRCSGPILSAMVLFLFVGIDDWSVTDQLKGPRW
jgi:hypothetical protein